MNELVTQNDIHNSTDIENDEEIEIEAGQYWLLKEGKENIGKFEISKGSRLKLIQSLNIIDGLLHSIELAPHPLSDSNTSIRIMTDRFLDDYELVPLELAEQMRAEEIEEINQELNKLRVEMQIGYIDEETGVSATKLLQNTSNQKGSVDNLPTTASKDIKQIKESANSLTTIAKKQSDFIKEKNELIVRATQKLSAMYQEKGRQALASVDGTMKFVQKLNIGVETLDIFIGKGVYVHELLKGESANKDEPLSFYQRKLYFDEEVFVAYADNGADINNIKDFPSELKKDKTLLDRFIPSQRGVVLFQVRRKEKDYLADKKDVSFGDMLYQNQMNQANKSCYLLLRNGENVYLIESEFLDGGKRLFPTAQETGGLYRKFTGVDEKIKPSDLEYVDSRDAHQSKTTYYKRILVLLSGLYGRDENVFGEFKDSEKYIGMWYNQDFQRECCKFVYDDEDALDFNAQSFSDYLADKNDYLRSGSRIMYLPRRLLNSESAPLLYRGEWNNYKVINKERNLAVVKREKQEHIIELKAYKETWNAQDGYGDSYKNCKVTLSESASGAYLVLDAVKASELKAFIDSRKQREFYLDYMELFIEAHKMLKAEEEEIEPFIDELMSYIQTDSKKDLKPIIEEAIRIYRADNGGAMLPISHKHHFEDKELRENYNNLIERVGKIVYSVLEQDVVLEKLKDAVSDKDIARIVVDAKGRYYAYADMPKEDRYEFLDDEIYPMIHKYELKVLKSKVSVSNAKVVYDKKSSIEKVLFQTKEPYASLKREDLDKIKERTGNKIHLFSEEYMSGLKDFENSFERSKIILDEVFSKEGLQKESIDILLGEYVKKNKKTKYWDNLTVNFPIALYGFHKEDTRKKYEEPKGMFNHDFDAKVKARKEAYLVYLQVDVLRLVSFHTYGENREYAEGLYKANRLNFNLKPLGYYQDSKKDKSKRDYMSFAVMNLAHIEKGTDYKFKKSDSMFFGYMYSGNYMGDFKINADTKIEALTFKEQYDSFLYNNTGLEVEIIKENEKIEEYYDMLRDDNIKEYDPSAYTNVDIYNSLSKKKSKLKCLKEMFKGFGFPKFRFESTNDDGELVNNTIEGIEEVEGKHVLKFAKREARGFVPDKLK